MKTRPPRVTPLTLKSKDALALSALLMKPRNARACFVFAHGAGAGMTHPFMEDLAAKLYGHGIATLRFQFPFMAKGSKRPDTPAVAHAAIRLAAAEARRRCRGRLIIAGGKSFGGRMTSQAQAEDPIEGIYALAFVGFPLQPAGKSSIIRAEHLAGIRIPMLFIQGTRDKLAEPALLRQVCKGLRSRATSLLIDGADHGFHIPVRSGRTDQDVVAEIALAISQWVERLKS
jgi:predicted alpha/beta-hydrolase family hydrolase